MLVEPLCQDLRGRHQTHAPWARLAVEHQLNAVAVDNDIAHSQTPKLEEPELRPLTAEEIVRLLGSVSDREPSGCRTKAILMLMLSTGIRRSGLVGLKDSDVNLEEGFVTVWGKGGKQRSIPFGYRTGWILQRYRILHCPTPQGPLVNGFFLTLSGRPLTIATLDMLFRRVRETSGVSRLHPHLLRHTYGARSAELGIPTLTLQRFMGHSQPSMTERYSHFALSDRLKRERAYDHLDRLNLKPTRSGSRWTVSRPRLSAWLR